MLLRKNVYFSLECENFFEIVKKLLCSEPCLAIFNLNRYYYSNERKFRWVVPAHPNDRKNNSKTCIYAANNTQIGTYSDQSVEISLDSLRVLAEIKLESPEPSITLILVEETPIGELTDSLEIRRILATNSKTSAPGIDGITYKVLRLIMSAHPELITDLINDYLRIQHFPDCWKPSKVIWIPKGTAMTEISNYRPITLLSCLGKTLERVIRDRIHKNVESNFHEKQFGFRPKRGTLDCLLDVMNTIKSGRITHKYTAAVSLDIRAVFDSVNWQHIINSCHFLNTPGYLQSMIISYFTGRTVPSGDTTVSLGKGCPQGSVLGPTLWNLGYDHVIRELDSGGASVRCYAEDTLLIVNSNMVQDITTSIVNAMTQTINLLRPVGLEINPTKTQIVILGLDETIDITVEGIQFPTLDQFKYLGLIIDKNLKWRSIKKSKTIHNIFLVLSSINSV